MKGRVPSSAERGGSSGCDSAAAESLTEGVAFFLEDLEVLCEREEEREERRERGRCSSTKETLTYSTCTGIHVYMYVYMYI